MFNCGIKQSTTPCFTEPQLHFLYSLQILNPAKAKNSLNTKIEIRLLKIIFDRNLEEQEAGRKMHLSFYESTRIFKIQVSLDLSHCGQRVSVWEINHYLRICLGSTWMAEICNWRKRDNKYVLTIMESIRRIRICITFSAPRNAPLSNPNLKPAGMLTKAIIWCSLLHVQKYKFCVKEKLMTSHSGWNQRHPQVNLLQVFALVLTLYISICNGESALLLPGLTRYVHCSSFFLL